jgi:hypothetical protein
LPISTPGVASACRPRKPAAETKGERDEEQPRVPPSPRRDPDRVAERDVDRRRGEDEPEVRRVVLPALVHRWVRQHQREHARPEGEQEERPERVRGGAG